MDRKNKRAKLLPKNYHSPTQVQTTHSALNRGNPYHLTIKFKNLK